MLGVIPDYGWVWPKKQKAKKKKPNLTMFSKDAFSLLWMETLSFFLLRHSTKILGEKKIHNKNTRSSSLAKPGEMQDFATKFHFYFVYD